MKETLLKFWKEEDGFIGSLLGNTLLKVGSSVFLQNKQRRNAVSDALLKGEHIRESAERGGFSPLAFLYGTQGTGFGNYTRPPLASQELLSGAVQDVVDHFDGTAEAERKETELRNDLLELQVEQARSGVAPPPTLKTRGARAVGILPRKASDGVGGEYVWPSPAYTQGDAAYDYAGNPHTPALTFGGHRWRTDPDTSDAEIAEQAYGDIAQEGWGLGKLSMDVWRGFWSLLPEVEELEKRAKINEERKKNRPPLFKKNPTPPLRLGGWGNVRPLIAPENQRFYQPGSLH